MYTGSYFFSTVYVSVPFHKTSRTVANTNFSKTVKYSIRLIKAVRMQLSRPTQNKR